MDCDRLDIQNLLENLGRRMGCRLQESLGHLCKENSLGLSFI